MAVRQSSSAERLHVVVASSGLGHVTRGIEIWAANLSRALRERGVLVTLCKGSGDQTQEFERVIHCWTRESRQTMTVMKWLPIRLTWRVGIGSAYDVEQVTFAVGLLKYLSRQKADILHVQDPRVARIMQAAFDSGLLKTRTILAHGTEESPEFLSHITYLQQLAPWHLEQTVKAGVAKSTWCAIPNFVDTSRFARNQNIEMRERLNIPPKAIVLLTVSAIKRHHKRIDWLIQEFGELRNRLQPDSAYLLVAGGWEGDTDELVREAEAAHGDKVRFLVRFPSERMPDVYAAADVFTICSLQEMMPIALLEAMASGLPCLTHDYPIAEWMTGPGGRKVDMTLKGALAAAWSDLIQHPEDRHQMGNAAREFCEHNFGKDRVVDQILAYYDFVLRS
jgi:glycosyltransferase involved in cell wall biosynthesis